MAVQISCNKSAMRIVEDRMAAIPETESVSANPVVGALDEKGDVEPIAAEATIDDALRQAAQRLNPSREVHDGVPVTRLAPFKSKFCADLMVWATFCFLFKVFKCDGYKALLLHCYSSVDWLAQQALLYVALHYVFHEDAECSSDNDCTDHQDTLMIMSGVYVLNMLFKHFVAHVTAEMRLGGRANILLREHAVNTMLQLTPEVNASLTLTLTLAYAT